MHALKILSLAALIAVLSGCVVAPYEEGYGVYPYPVAPVGEGYYPGPYHGHHHHHHDEDEDD